MPKCRRAIPLSFSEDSSLRQQYIHFRIPTDQYKTRTEALQTFADTWNFATGRSDTGEELLHYMITQRKQKVKKWPTFDGDHLRSPSSEGLLSPDEEQILRRVYTDLILPLNIGTEEFGYDRELKDAVARRFSIAARRAIPGDTLVGFIEARRKRGKWMTLRDDRRGFGDMDEAAGM